MTIKVVFLGGSSTLGLGVQGRSYAVRYAEKLGADVETLQLSKSAQTVADVAPETLAQIRDFRPDVVLLSFGAAEGHVHPSRFLQRILDRFAPQSWRGPAGMEPRPYFSKTRTKRLRQVLMSGTKVQVKRAIIAVSGGYHRLPSDEFDAGLRKILDELGPATKVLIGLWRVDPYKFPRSNPVLRHNDELLQAIAAERDDVRFVNTADAVHYWDDFLADHAHLNEAGHDRVADLILDATSRTPAAASR
ncbi:SGNH/GDSL hydrolase family protein [Actinoplanes sp. NPDC051859]|uniref:SGNH/GDSL hydrolase family protein n=1 Tax=Actinoplanes sp. NPDC051859 TaxID=3363909 RepID=UPI0037A74745